MLDILVQNPILFVVLILALIISVTVHEFAHALVTDKLGDPTARYFGRVTLNPKAHIDLTGLVFLILTGFGWGRPVPFDYINLKNPRRDAALIALAGPMSNFTLAIVLSLLMRFLNLGTLLGSIVNIIAYYNVVLGVFNLLPFHPLDGFKVVFGVLPVDLAGQWQQTEKYGIFVLLLIIFTGSLGKLMFPIIHILTTLLGIA